MNPIDELEAPPQAPEELVGAERLEEQAVDVSEILPEGPKETAETEFDTSRRDLKALLEAIIYVIDEPKSAQQIAAALEQPEPLIQELLNELIAGYERPDRGLAIREVAGGFKMGTKPEHHEEIKRFVKNLKPPVKLSPAALETLAVIAYKQPITGPEILEIRGVQGGGVLKTLLDRKLITGAGRKQVVGKPMLYKTTKEFLLQFGLKDIAELPTLKEFEELRRLALSEPEVEPGDVEGPAAPGEAAPAPVETALPPQPESEPENG
jgi:segregation and condensation protein B